MSKQFAVMGGGAAGFFGAIACAERAPASRVVIFEKGPHLLSKVKVSGGGRCNVTHACFEPRALVRNYPRGAVELLGPFTRFGPKNTVDWFAKHGVKLKTEADGRMFPVTDSSQTIIDCLMHAASAAEVEIRKQCAIEALQPRAEGGFILELNDGSSFEADALLMACGGNPSNKGWELTKSAGHTIVPAVPSLFTFNIQDHRIHGLQGLSMPDVHIDIVGHKLSSQGPMLITHWGLSGPAVLKLSAWAARELQACDYHFEIKVNFLAHMSSVELASALQALKHEEAKRLVSHRLYFGFPLRLWQSLVAASGIGEQVRWTDLNKEQLLALANTISAATFAVRGKSTFKEEFVTAGGIALNEVDFKTAQSKKLPGLYFAGECLDIDGITGGFNFQAAWTMGMHAGCAMASSPLA